MKPLRSVWRGYYSADTIARWVCQGAMSQPFTETKGIVSQPSTRPGVTGTGGRTPTKVRCPC